jgi:hypothetical protein
VVERLFVIFAHIFANVLIFYAIASGEAKWGWLAILYKTLLDAPGGFASFWGTGTADRTVGHNPDCPALLADLQRAASGKLAAIGIAVFCSGKDHHVEAVTIAIH